MDADLSKACEPSLGVASDFKTQIMKFKSKSSNTDGIISKKVSDLTSKNMLRHVPPTSVTSFIITSLSSVELCYVSSTANFF